MDAARLAFRYAAYHWGKSLILVISLACALFVPLALHALVVAGETQIMSRARNTPLVIGAPGSKLDLVLHALHFTERPLATLTWKDAEDARALDLAGVIPLYAAFRARGYPVVGVALEYYDFRGLSPAAGTKPMLLGDCVLGATVAKELGLRPSDALLSDPENVFNIAGAYPLKMHVAGVLAARGTDEDRAVFVDIKTAWVIAGLGHGHEDLAATADAKVVLKRSSTEVVANAALPQFNEITPENLARFHFHGDTGTFPVTAILLDPDSTKSATILEGRLQEDPARWHVVRPTQVIEDLMATVIKVKRLFDANVALVAGTTALLVGLVVLLSVRMRADEMTIMMKLGCSRGMMVRMQAIELAGIAAASSVLAVAGAWAISRAAMTVIPWLFG